MHQLTGCAVLRKYCAPVFFFLVLAIFVGRMAAQAPDTATLKGQISDQSQAAVPGAECRSRAASHWNHQPTARSLATDYGAIGVLKLGDVS